jgi:RecB family exonuclease
MSNFFFEEGIMMLKNFYQKNGHKDVTIISLEASFEISLTDQNDQIHIVSGIIDRIQKTDTRYEVMDYKTGKRLPTQTKVDQNNQLSIYALAFLDK